MRELARLVTGPWRMTALLAIGSIACIAQAQDSPSDSWIEAHAKRIKDRIQEIEKLKRPEDVVQKYYLGVYEDTGTSVGLMLGEITPLSKQLWLKRRDGGKWAICKSASERDEGGLEAVFEIPGGIFACVFKGEKVLPAGGPEFKPDTCDGAIYGTPEFIYVVNAGEPGLIAFSRKQE